jgi:copper(I)-binding protein
MPIPLSRTALALTVGLAFTATACGAAADDAVTAAETTTTAPAAVGVEVTGAWARASAEGQTRGAAYLTIVSPTDDAIVAASVSGDVAGAVELHETTADHGAADHGAGHYGAAGHGAAGHDGADGTMVMRAVERIELPAGEPVELRPGGLHIMLLDLSEPLVAGDSFTLTLTLASGEEVDVDVEVREQAP